MFVLIVDFDDVNNDKFYFSFDFCFSCARQIKEFTNQDITFLYDLQDRFWNTLLGEITLIRKSDQPPLFNLTIKEFNAIHM